MSSLSREGQSQPCGQPRLLEPHRCWGQRLPWGLVSLWFHFPTFTFAGLLPVFSFEGFFFKKSFVSSLKFFTCIHWSYPPPTPLQISPRLDISSSHLRVLNMLCFPGCHPLSDDGMLVVVAGVTLCGPCAAHHSCRAHEWKSRVVPRRQYFTAFSPSSPRAMSLSFGGVCPLRAGLNSHSLQYFGQFWNSVLMATHHGRGVPGWHWACFLFNNEDRRRQRHALCCIVRDAETSHHQRLLP